MSYYPMKQWGPFFIPYFHSIPFFSFMPDMECPSANNHLQERKFQQRVCERIQSIFSCVYTHAHRHIHTKAWCFPALLQSSWDEASLRKTERTLFIPKSLYRPAVSAPIPLSQPSGSYAHIEFTTSCTLTPCSRCQTSKWHVISQSVWLSAFLGKQDPHRERKGVVMILGYETENTKPYLQRLHFVNLLCFMWQLIHDMNKENQRENHTDMSNSGQVENTWSRWWYSCGTQKNKNLSVLLLPSSRDSRFIYSLMTGSAFTNCLKRVKFATVVKR